MGAAAEGHLITLLRQVDQGYFNAQQLWGTPENSEEASLSLRQGDSALDIFRRGVLGLRGLLLPSSCPLWARKVAAEAVPAWQELLRPVVRLPS